MTCAVKHLKPNHEWGQLKGCKFTQLYLDMRSSMTYDKVISVMAEEFELPGNKTYLLLNTRADIIQEVDFLNIQNYVYSQRKYVGKNRIYLGIIEEEHNIPDTEKTVASKAEEGTAGTVTQKAEAGTVTQMAQARTVGQKAQVGTVTLKAKEVTVVPKAEEGGTAGNVTQKAQAGTVTQKVQAGTVTQKAQVGTVTQMAQVGTVTQMAQVGTVTQMAQAGTVTQMAQAGTVTQMAQAGTVTQNAHAGTVTQNALAGTVTQNALAGTVTQKVKEDTMTPKAPQQTVTFHVPEMTATADTLEGMVTCGLTKTMAMPKVLGTMSVLRNIIDMPQNQGEEVGQIPQSTATLQAPNQTVTLQIGESPNNMQKPVVSTPEGKMAQPPPEPQGNVELFTQALEFISQENQDLTNRGDMLPGWPDTGPEICPVYAWHAQAQLFADFSNERPPEISTPYGNFFLVPFSRMHEYDMYENALELKDLAFVSPALEYYLAYVHHTDDETITITKFTKHLYQLPPGVNQMYEQWKKSLSHS